MSKTTVIIADDSGAMRASVRRLLEVDFQVVGEASDGAEAVELVEELAPDAVVMDISMPALSGIDAARRLRDGGCRSAIVFLSVHGHRRIVARALETPDSGFVAKPDADRELADAIHAVVSGSRFVSSSLA